MLLSNGEIMRCPRLTVHLIPVAPEQASFYDTSELAATLMRLVDFECLNRNDAMRLTVSTLKVTDGDLASFDNRTQAMTVDHIFASGALLSAFPPVRIDGQLYWDGGLYSRAPRKIYGHPPFCKGRFWVCDWLA